MRDTTAVLLLMLILISLLLLDGRNSIRLDKQLKSIQSLEFRIERLEQPGLIQDFTRED